MQINNAKISLATDYEYNLRIHIQQEEPLFLGFCPNQRASSLLVNLVLDQGNAAHFQ